ncbi:MAG: hypothetical protein ACLQUY_29340 [Ktedonobacterales bacterium]
MPRRRGATIALDYPQCPEDHQIGKQQPLPVSSQRDHQSRHQTHSLAEQVTRQVIDEHTGTVVRHAQKQAVNDVGATYQREPQFVRYNGR